MMKEMKMLLWKDYRLSRICLLAGVIIIILPYLLLLFPYVFCRFHFSFVYAWLVSTESSQLTMALLAGNIIACERADRSAEFLAYQGASRKMVIGSKLILCTITFILICAISFVLSFWLSPLPNMGVNAESWKLQLSCAIIGLCFFGCCWLFSALLSSPAIAIVIGFATPIVIALALSEIFYVFNWKSENLFGILLFSLYAMAGLISLVAGTWYFIRSKES